MGFGGWTVASTREIDYASRPMPERVLPVAERHAGQRIDKFLTGEIPELGRSKARKLFEAGRVRLNGRRARKGDVVDAGDQVVVELPETLSPTAVAEPDAPLRVLLETDEVLVLEKPAGQPTAPLEPGETGTLANALVGRYPELAGIGYSPREPGLLHRLDTDTSGIVIAARTPEAFETLAAALKEGRLEKRYLLVCEQEGLADTGTIEIPIAPHPKDRRRVYPCVHPRDVARYAPRPAMTSYRVLRREGELALVEARAPKAMRHQVRAHMAAIGHPLVGDLLYGGKEVTGLGRHALHASHVKWTGDATVPAFEIHSELPDELASLLGGGDGGSVED